MAAPRNKNWLLDFFLMVAMGTIPNHWAQSAMSLLLGGILPCAAGPCKSWEGVCSLCLWGGPLTRASPALLVTT